MNLLQDPNCDSWPIVKPWLEDACDECDGWWTTEHLVSLLCDGKAVLWVLEDSGKPVAAVVTAIGDWNAVKVAEIIATGGNGVIEALASELPKIETWARNNGAAEILFRGRRGWSRVYKPLGYEEIAITMRKALT